MPVEQSKMQQQVLQFDRNTGKLILIVKQVDVKADNIVYQRMEEAGFGPCTE